MAARLAALGTALGLSLRVDRRRTVGVLVSFGTRPLCLVLVAYWVQLLLDAASRRDGGAVVTAAVLIAVTTAANLFLGWLGVRLAVSLIENAGQHLDRRLMELVSGTEGIGHFARADYLEDLELLREERRVLAEAVDTAGLALGTATRLAGTGALLFVVEPLLLALPLLAVPLLWVGARGERLRQRALRDTAADRRLAEHVYGVATSPAAAPDVRVYGFGADLSAIGARAWRRSVAAVDRATVRATALTAGGWLLFAAGYLSATVLVLDSYLAGTASLGQIVLALTLMSTINAQLAQAVAATAKLIRTVPVAQRFRRLEAYGEPRPPGEPAPLPARVRGGLSFTDVRFRYPGASTDALAGLTLHLPAGTTVALVGENGSGKSTLVSLACRLHRPTGGRIELDGVDVERFDPSRWRSRITALFQDFARLEFTAGEVVGAGDLPRADDRTAVAAALRGAAADGDVARLPHGLATPLGRSFADGAELSGGQWQRISLARTLMRTTPLLLLLDEPTSAIDPEAEHELFTRYLAAAKAVAADTGAVTLVTAHRMSAVRLADLIVVLRDGQVAEQGTHAGLLAAGGLYADLFSLQANAYRD